MGCAIPHKFASGVLVEPTHADEAKTTSVGRSWLNFRGWQVLNIALYPAEDLFEVTEPSLSGKHTAKVFRFPRMEGDKGVT